MPVKGSCHCKAIQFEVAEAPTELTTCNCSLCSKRGTLVAYYPLAQFKLTTSPNRVETYQWGDYLGEHNFCGVCGMNTHSKFPDFSTGELDFENPRIAVNARLLDDFDVSSLPVTHLNGRDDW